MDAGMDGLDAMMAELAAGPCVCVLPAPALACADLALSSVPRHSPVTALFAISHTSAPKPAKPAAAAPMKPAASRPAKAAPRVIDGFDESGQLVRGRDVFAIVK